MNRQKADIKLNSNAGSTTFWCGTQRARSSKGRKGATKNTREGLWKKVLLKIPETAFEKNVLQKPGEPCYMGVHLTGSHIRWMCNVHAC